jgi:Subtilisin inhibitor-like
MDPKGESRLVVEVRDTPDGEPVRWTLEDDPPGGDHPDPVGACAALAAAEDPFSPVPAGVRCAQVWSGPEVAVISGTWRGRPVRAAYRRTDACEEDRWRAVAAVVRPPTPTSGG